MRQLEFNIPGIILHTPHWKLHDVPHANCPLPHLKSGPQHSPYGDPIHEHPFPQDPSGVYGGHVPARGWHALPQENAVLPHLSVGTDEHCVLNERPGKAHSSAKKGLGGVTYCLHHSILHIQIPCRCIPSCHHIFHWERQSKSKRDYNYSWSLRSNISYHLKMNVSLRCLRRCLLLSWKLCLRRMIWLTGTRIRSLY